MVLPDNDQGDAMHFTTLAFPAEDLIGWERVLYAFLVDSMGSSC